MVKTLVFRPIVIVCIFIGLLALFSLAPIAHAATKPSCAVTEVTLHGTASPTVKCRTVTIAVHPNAGVNPACQNPDELDLYWNGPKEVHPNYVLCIYGSGVLNLNQQFQTSPDNSNRNWNDQASAWWTGCHDVTFYSDINQHGPSVMEPGSNFGANSPSGVFPLGGIGNDQLSSVWLHPSAYPDCTG